MTEFEPSPPPSASDTVTRPGRRWRDVAFLGIICLALVSPWIASTLLHSPSPMTTTAPQAPARVVLPLPPELPQDPTDRLALDTAQQGVRDVLEMHDSSAPPPVFDPTQIRVDHSGKDVWTVTGIVTTAWQMLMAEPHLYKADVYRVCHIMAAACFKTRGVTIDSEVVLAP